MGALLGVACGAGGCNGGGLRFRPDAVRLAAPGGYWWAGNLSTSCDGFGSVRHGQARGRLGRYGGCPQPSKGFRAGGSPKFSLDSADHEPKLT